MRKSFPFLLVVAALVSGARAVETKFWVQSDQADFQKGTVKRLSVRSDGRLSLAPVFSELFDSSTAYLWALAEDSQGNLYAGGGAPGASTAKLFRIDAKGAAKTLAELPGLEIHSLAVNAKDQVFAATSPDGKIYRVGPEGRAEVFYDPKTKYVWAMAFNSRGDLFVATGDQGEIHRIAPDGQGGVFFKTEETHARSLAVDARDQLIVGTEPGGLVLRISPAGDGFVLYQSAKREVTAVTVGADGSIYAAAAGAKQPPTPALAPPPVPLAPVPAVPSPAPAQPAAPSGQRAPMPPPPTFGLGVPSISGGSDVYRIAPDGYPRKIWSDPQEIAYAIGFDGAGRPLIGTGNKGNIYRLDTDLLSSLLVSAAPTQVTVVAAGRKGAVYAVTGNVGKVYRLGPELEKDGYLESDPFDAGSFAYWGRLTFLGEADGGRITFETRSGNLDRPQKNWSRWAGVDLAGTSRVVSPAARFLQWKLTLAGAADGRSPELRRVEAAWQARNVAPVVELIEITPANHRFQPQTLSITPSQSLTLPSLAARKRPAAPPLSIDMSSQTMQYAKGHLGARWLASDENGDSLSFKVEIRGTQETEWKLLKDQVRDKFLSWDSAGFADGQYRLRVTASDAPGNTPASALTRSLESDVFFIDNTPPRIAGLAAAAEGNSIRVRFMARDALSAVDKAEYSLNGGEWTLLEPVTKLTDGPALDYNFLVPRSSPGEQTIAVRVADEYENQAVEKTVLK